jgi:nucleoside-diphosphate-sugar epimerase
LGALETAVMGTARLLQAVRDAGRPITVVVSASDKVYGDAPSPYTEATPLDARHAYEVSKACQDLVARMYFHNYGVDVRVARAVNIYGPGDPNETRLIPRTIRRVLAGEPPLLHAGAGDMRRQYVYIDDLVNAFRVIREKGSPGEAYCVGSPDPAMSVREVMEEIATQAGQPMVAPEIRERDARFQEIPEQSIDARKLRSLGWSPLVSFRDGIHRVIQDARGHIEWAGCL